MNVLIIHRQQSFLQSAKEKFTLGGWHVQTCDNGLDGLMTARHRQFDLILCGFDLRVISGTEVVRSLRTLSINNATPVFFLTTGKEADSQKELAGRLEANCMSETEIETSKQLTWF